MVGAETAGPGCPTLPGVSGSGVDPARVAALKEREDAAFVAMRPRSQALWADGAGRDAERRPHELAAHVVRPPTAVHRVGRRIPPARRRRPRVRRLQHRRHVHVHRLRSGARGRGGEPAGRAGRAVPPADRGLDLGRRRAGPALRPAAVAVHPGGDEREHRGDPDRPVLDRPREGAVLRREVPRPLRRRPGRARRRPPGAGGGRPAARRHDPDARRAVQRPRRPGARAREPRGGRGDHRAGPHQQRRPPDARRRLPRGPARGDPGHRHAAGLRRDAYAGRRPRRPHAGGGGSRPTS